jgi:hypothetical protein
MSVEACNVKSLNLTYVDCPKGIPKNLDTIPSEVPVKVPESSLTCGTARGYNGLASTDRIRKENLTTKVRR